MEIICVNKSENIKNLTINKEYYTESNELPEDWVYVVNDSGNVARYASKFFKAKEELPESLEDFMKLVSYKFDSGLSFVLSNSDLTISFKDTNLQLPLPNITNGNISCGIFEMYDCHSSFTLIVERLSVLSNNSIIKKVLQHFGGNSKELFAKEIIKRAITEIVDKKPGAFLIANLIPSSSKYLFDLFEELADTITDWSQNSNDTSYNDNKIFIFKLNTTEEDIEDEEYEDDEW